MYSLATNLRLNGACVVRQEFRDINATVSHGDQWNKDYNLWGLLDEALSPCPVLSAYEDAVVRNSRTLRITETTFVFSLFGIWNLFFESSRENNKSDFSWLGAGTESSILLWISDCGTVSLSGTSAYIFVVPKLGAVYFKTLNILAWSIFFRY
jgi:hypothetical protein